MKLGISGALTRTFINSPLTPLLLLAALVAGAIALVSLPREEEPQISVPMVDIMVSAPGVRAPDGVTVVRRVRHDEEPAEPWRAFHGEAGHDLDLPGMLLAVVRPLGEAGVPVFVCSTFDADLVLVPAGRVEEASDLLAAAGHEVRR